MPPKKHPKINNDDGKVINFYEHIGNEFLDKPYSNPNKHLTNMDVPFRLVCSANSGSGKTNWLVNLISLFSKGKGTFSSILIITKDSSEPLYKYLASLSDAIQVKEGLEHLPPLNKEKEDKELLKLIVIDDCQLDKNQHRVCDYYIRCRKFGYCIAYLCQQFYECPLIVRRNCNYMCLLKTGSAREMKMVLKECGSSKVEPEQILKMYEAATKTKFNPLIIHMEESDPYKRYWSGFRTPLNPDDFK
jgi:hypothetical protein